MTDNELIAEWCGATILRPANVNEQLDMPVGTLFWSDIGSGEKIYLRARGTFPLWEPNTDITLWHGDDGLLAEIDRKMGHDCDYLRCLRTVLDPTRVTESWMGLMSMGLRATPAQLTAALVKMIKEAT